MTGALDEVEEATPRPSWRVRRIWVALIEAYCALGVGYLIVMGQDTRLNETIAAGLLLLAGSTIGSYIFGAVWDDNNVMRRPGAGGGPRPRRADPYASYGAAEDLQPPDGYAR